MAALVQPAAVKHPVWRVLYHSHFEKFNFLFYYYCETILMDLFFYMADLLGRFIPKNVVKWPWSRLVGYYRLHWHLSCTSLTHSCLTLAVRKNIVLLLLIYPYEYIPLYDWRLGRFILIQVLPFAGRSVQPLLNCGFNCNGNWNTLTRINLPKMSIPWISRFLRIY